MSDLDVLRKLYMLYKTQMRARRTIDSDLRYMYLWEYQ